MVVDLPGLYDYYATPAIQAGLSADQTYFTLNNLNITLYGGSFHYFRVPRAYWRDRLRKMRAAGLNAVSTYVPWNLHEPEQGKMAEGKYDFGTGGSDFEDFLHLDEFLRTVREEDMFALIRPGPYINSEFEFGGLPSWISNKVRRIRSSADRYYLAFVAAFFNVLMPLLATHQFQRGGPIIAFQIENEFGSKHVQDTAYLSQLKDLMTKHGISELFYTSDPPRNGRYGAVPGVLQAVNFNGDPKEMFDQLNALQRGKPDLCMESYTGWFDHWGEGHRHKSPSQYQAQLEKILDYPGSVNMYMFVGSTNYGFTNGATLIPTANNSALKPITTSYDYDSPLSEYGTKTVKYDLIKETIAKHNLIQTRLPEFPPDTPLMAYPDLRPAGQLPLTQAIRQVGRSIKSETIQTMEETGQNWGYIVYRKTGLDLQKNSLLKLPDYVRDTVLVLLNGELISPVPTRLDDLNGFGFWRLYEPTLELNARPIQNATLEIVVENAGRNTLGVYMFKGLKGDVTINNAKVLDWEIVPLEFKRSYNVGLKGWIEPEAAGAAALHRFPLDIEGAPSDTFLDMRGWTKGVVLVNGFVLGRYFFVGPQMTLYLAAPFLRTGRNEIVVFEHYKSPGELKFVDQPVWQVSN
ncbi:unnamed protein product [Phyllotreta striolata]|uniref:Beta-galactosidase n=1 Tax=Phyllotreta striolata TaxID=444603 RepID=A0A9N9XMT5_PHYSR|nr:unnamed protein product [Phyllotreta striolata]